MGGSSFEIGGAKFKLSKIDAFKQFHIVRRMAPILTEMIPAFKQIKDSKDQDVSEEEKFDQFVKISAPIIAGLSKLSDEDADKVMLGLLSSVEMGGLGGAGWSKVANHQMIMIQSIELPVLLQLAGRAFAFNLSGFFSALPQPS